MQGFWGASLVKIITSKLINNEQYMGKQGNGYFIFCNDHHTLSQLCVLPFFANDTLFISVGWPIYNVSGIALIPRLVFCFRVLPPLAVPFLSGHWAHAELSIGDPVVISVWSRVACHKYIHSFFGGLSDVFKLSLHVTHNRGIVLLQNMRDIFLIISYSTS